MTVFTSKLLNLGHEQRVLRLIKWLASGFFNRLVIIVYQFINNQYAESNFTEQHHEQHFQELLGDYSVRGLEETELAIVGVEVTADEVIAPNNLQFDDRPNYQQVRIRGLCLRPWLCPWCAHDSSLSWSERMRG